MKVWFVLPAMCMSLMACDSVNRQVVAVEEVTAATPAPAQKQGDWMWDKEKRGNPLEAAPHTRRYR